jgi:hypothetical protein
MKTVNVESIKRMADETVKLSEWNGSGLCYLIAVKLISINGYYTYTDHATKKNICGGLTMYIYRNSFHRTEARSRYSKQELYDSYEQCHGDVWGSLVDVSGYDANMLRVIRRISSALFPTPFCTCGDWLGERK